MGVSGRPCFLSSVISDSTTFVLDRSCAETGELLFFFKGTLRAFDLEELLVFLTIPLIFQTEQGVQTGEQFFK